MPPPIAPDPSEPVFNWSNVNGESWTTPAKNQGMCGSRTVFAAISAIEGVYNVVADDPNLDLDLSEQNVLSCTSVACLFGGTPTVPLVSAKNAGVPVKSATPIFNRKAGATGPVRIGRIVQGRSITGGMFQEDLVKILQNSR